MIEDDITLFLVLGILVVAGYFVFSIQNSNSDPNAPNGSLLDKILNQAAIGPSSQSMSTAISTTAGNPGAVVTSILGGNPAATNTPNPTGQSSWMDSWWTPW